MFHLIIIFWRYNTSLYPTSLLLVNVNSSSIQRLPNGASERGYHFCEIYSNTKKDGIFFSRRSCFLQTDGAVFDKTMRQRYCMHRVVIWTLFKKLWVGHTAPLHRPRIPQALHWPWTRASGTNRLSCYSTVMRGVTGWLTSNGLERTWKRSWPNLRSYADMCLEGLRKIIKIL